MSEGGEPSGENQEGAFPSNEEIFEQVERKGDDAKPYPKEVPTTHIEIHTVDQTTPEMFIKHYGINGRKAPVLNEEMKELLTDFFRIFKTTKSVDPLREIVSQYETMEHKTQGQETALWVLKDYVWYLNLHLEPVFKDPDEPPSKPVPFPEVTSEVVSTDLVQEEGAEPENIQEDIRPVDELLDDLSTGEVAQAEAVLDEMDWQPKNDRELEAALVAVNKLGLAPEAPVHGRRAFRYADLPPEPEKRQNPAAHRSKPIRPRKPPVT